jgi:ethanolamine ammonia-lyase small subunit
MNPELIEQVTKMIIEKVQSQQSAVNEQEIEDTSRTTPVKFWNHTSSNESLSTPSSIVMSEEENMKNEVISKNKLIEIRNYNDSHSFDSSKREKDGNDQTRGHESRSSNLDELKELVSKTPARIGVGRAGLRPKTDTWLKFRFDHAAAVDAVYGDVNEDLLNRLDLFKVNTMVKDKEVYIRRPDLGRKLSDESKQLIKTKCKKEPTVQIIVSDGLSSSAVEENVEDVYLSLQQSLNSLGLDIGTPFFVERGRVALMDDVGELLNPKVVVLLIGERPGLVSAESLSAYLCYEPRKGTIEADRMVISNIHKGGIPPVEAGAYLGPVIQKILKHEASGVSLVRKED